jgi:hypothetical protein
MLLATTKGQHSLRLQVLKPCRAIPVMTLTKDPDLVAAIELETVLQHQLWMTMRHFLLWELDPKQVKSTMASGEVMATVIKKMLLPAPSLMWSRCHHRRVLLHCGKMPRRWVEMVVPQVYAMVKIVLQRKQSQVLNMFHGWKLGSEPTKHTSKPGKML